MIKMLRPEDVWQPKVGAPRGNRNARKRGLHDARMRGLRKRIAAFRRDARDLVKWAQNERRARQTSEYRPHQYPAINSDAQSGSRTSPRGRNPRITGLMSSTGVPSMASSPRTVPIGLRTIVSDIVRSPLSLFARLLHPRDGPRYASPRIARAPGRTVFGVYSYWELMLRLPGLPYRLRVLALFRDHHG
jgi:hypothetical protein